MDDLVRVSIGELAYAIELLTRVAVSGDNTGQALLSVESAAARLRRFLNIATKQETTS